MKVFLKKDIEKVGIAGEIIEVKEGFAANYLIPHGLATVVNNKNSSFFKRRERTIENRKEAISSKTSLLAAKIGTTEITLKKKTHDDGKLYGAINAGDIVDKLAESGIAIAKNQVIFAKSIKARGVYEITVKLSSRLQPKIKVKVVSE